MDHITFCNKINNFNLVRSKFNHIAYLYNIILKVIVLPIAFTLILKMVNYRVILMNEKYYSKLLFFKKNSFFLYILYNNEKMLKEKLKI